MSSLKMCRALLVVSLMVTLAACDKSSDENATQSTAPTVPTSAAVALSSQTAVNARPLSEDELGTAASSAGHCSLDTINGARFENGATKATVKAGSVFTAAGWVVDTAMKSPAQFTLVLEGAKSFGFAATTSVLRPDVAKAMSADTAGKSGFGISANLATVPDGTYKVMVLVKETNGRERCDVQRQLGVGG